MFFSLVIGRDIHVKLRLPEHGMRNVVDGNAV